MAQFCTKKAPGFGDALNSRHAPEQNGRRAREFGSNRSLLKAPDNGLGHARAAQLLTASRRCCARPIICELRTLRALHRYCHWLYAGAAAALSRVAGREMSSGNNRSQSGFPKCSRPVVAESNRVCIAGTRRLTSLRDHEREWRRCPSAPPARRPPTPC